MQNNDGWETRQERRARLRKSATHSNARVSGSRDIEKLTDENLIFRVAKNDNRALEELIKRYRPKVALSCFEILKDPTEVDECMNRVWTSIWRGSRKFRFESAVSSWIYRICRNEALMMIRALNGKDNSRKETVFLQCLEEDTQHAVVHNYHAKDLEGLMEEEERRTLQQALIDAVLKLEKEHRDIFQLCFIADTPPMKAAKILRVSVAATKSRIFRAKLQLQRLLRTEGKELKKRLKKAA